MANKVQIYTDEIVKARDGVTAEYEVVCEWAEKDTIAPQIGQPHPMEYGLYCVEVRIRGEGQPVSDHVYTHARIRAIYSTAQYVDAAPIQTLEFGGEILETGLGRKWTYAKTKCDQSQGIWYPTVILNQQLMFWEVNTALILSCVGKVNYWPFLNCGHETLLFEGASTESVWDGLRNTYMYRVNYRFLYRPNGHNTVWRAPRQARDSQTGGLLDTGAPDFDPVFVKGIAGVGGWDRPKPLLYDYADFNPLFGWPAQPVPQFYYANTSGLAAVTKE